MVVSLLGAAADRSITTKPDVRNRYEHDMRNLTAIASVACALVACFLSLIAMAGAAPVNEPNIQIKDVRPGGGYTIVFSANSYDTTGQQPPRLTSSSLRLAAGVTIRPQFLSSRYQCDAPKLSEIVVVNPEKSIAQSKRFANLAATLRRIRKKLTRVEVAIVEACIRAEIGQGVVVTDTRPFVADPIPAQLTLYLSKPTQKGAIASLGVLVTLDESAKSYREKSLLRLLGPITFYANIFNEPSADGLYGYRLALPTPPTNLVLDVKISLAEVRVTARGLTQEKKVVTCVRRAGAACRGRKVTTQRTFWLTQPKCPVTGQLGFETSYTYETGLQITKKVDVPCPRFQP